MQGIYTIQNMLDKTLYIGSSVNIENRLHKHKYSLAKNKHRNVYLQRAYNKDGLENFIFKPEEIVEDKNELVFTEQQWIDVLKENGFELYNFCPIAGSTLGSKHTEKTKKKLSLYFKEKYIGKNNPNFGNCHSEETKKKISEATKERFKNKENCPWYGRHHSEETKQKISLSKKGTHIGDKNPFYGKYHTDATKEKMKECWKSRKKLLG